MGFLIQVAWEEVGWSSVEWTCDEKVDGGLMSCLLKRGFMGSCSVLRILLGVLHVRRFVNCLWTW